jgi:integrase
MWPSLRCSRSWSWFRRRVRRAGSRTEGKIGKLRATDDCHIGGMCYPEPDLAVLKALVTEEPWLAIGETPVDARRLALICALAWLAGAGTGEMSRLRVRDWMPDNVVAILLTRAIVEERADGGRNPRPRLIPALPLLRRAVERRLADMLDADPDALLLASRAPYDRSPRGFVETSGPLIAEASRRATESVIELAKRYKAYLTFSGEDPKVVWWAAGSVKRAKNLPFSELSRETHDYEPPLAVVRSLLERWHPGA